MAVPRSNTTTSRANTIALKRTVSGPIFQKLKLTSDEAQFGSQFNGARSVQQIAKNLRLDLKSVRQLLFRFVALEIVECWPSSTTAKPEPKAGMGRLFGRGR